MMQQQLKLPQVQYSLTSLGPRFGGGGVTPGGMDMVTPDLALHSGAVREGLNFEVGLNGGYLRIEGYERFDGKTAPSAAAYIIVQVTRFLNAPSAGDVVTQASSGASATVADTNNDQNGTYLVLTLLSGAFDTAGVITNSTTGDTVGTATVTTATPGPRNSAQHQAAAADVYRDLINPVPGFGPILGVVAMTFAGVDEVFAFRATNGAGTALAIYKASAGGWTLVPFLRIVEFTAGGTTTPFDGEILTQGGVTATIRRVMTRSGAWTGTAAGAFVITTPAGGSFAAGAATASGSATVTLSGADTAITMLPGGRFEFAKANFGGQSATRRIYGCDGVNKAFEFDGVTLAPITTGLVDDAPDHIAAHNGFLFLGKEGSLIFSGPGTPFRYQAVDGGGEIAVGDDITNLLTLPGQQSTASLGVWQQSNTSILYGNDPSSWNLVNLNTGSGARPRTAQNLFDSFVLDDPGVVTLQTTLSFGNFASSSLTQKMTPFILRTRQNATCSSIHRAKGQYRLFFRNGDGLWLTVINQTYLGAIPILFPNPVDCCDHDSTGGGDEVTYFGSSDGQGYVYQMDKGTSFDGKAIEAYLTLAVDFMKSPRINKRFRAASIDIRSNFYARVEFGYKLGYGRAHLAQPDAARAVVNVTQPARWDVDLIWDAFTWDGVTLWPSELDMTGTGENIQVTLRSSEKIIAAYEVNNILYHYSPRRGARV